MFLKLSLVLLFAKKLDFIVQSSDLKKKDTFKWHLLVVKVVEKVENHWPIRTPLSGRNMGQQRFEDDISL